MPRIDWPSVIRGGALEDDGRAIGTKLGETARLAYLYAAHLSEWELSDGRGGEELYTAAGSFTDELERLAGLR
jgi:hypothetical protein